MNLRHFRTLKNRQEYLGKLLKISLKNTASFSLDEKVAGKRNCENMIGATQVPLGVAGPLKIKTSDQIPDTSDYFIPLATTEGALVASVNRGCKAITLSGGATVVVENVGATRGPVFKTEGIAESLKLKKWFDDNFTLLAKTAEKTSSYLKLKRLETRMGGRNVYVRFYFDTTDAMGMNMVTIATTSIIRCIEVRTGVKCLSVAGNFDIDKKPGWLNFLSGRGRRVWGEIVLPKKIIKDVLKTTCQKMHEVVISKCWLGSIMSGSLGFNAHFANIIAALFIATGQDPGHIVEGSLGITTTEILSNSDLYFSVYLPSLMVGTVGGGTGLATQKEALGIMGVAGAGRVEEFAGVVGGAVLAGEISLIASLAEGSLAKAHQKLGR